VRAADADADADAEAPGVTSGAGALGASATHAPLGSGRIPPGHAGAITTPMDDDAAGPPSPVVDVPAGVLHAPPKTNRPPARRAAVKQRVEADRVCTMRSTLTPDTTDCYRLPHM
jgi:hypothetical protein